KIQKSKLTKSNQIDSIIQIHLEEESQFVEEAQVLNQFWKYYLTSIEFINSCMFCCAFYLLAIAKSPIFLKIFCVIAIIFPIVMLVVSISLAASPNNFTLSLHSKYIFVLYNLKSMKLKTKLKVRGF